MIQSARQSVPEWHVFVRKPNGTSDHFTFTQRRQMAFLGGIAVLAIWAGAATWLLTRQPETLEAKERQLEEMMASYRSAQHRLTSAHKMVGEITREIDSVHGNLRVLAESNAVLAKDRPAKMAQIGQAKAQVGGDPLYDEDGQPGSAEAKAVRDQVRALESALERLRNTYAKVAQSTADLAGARIDETEKTLARLGLTPDKMVGQPIRRTGQGGPFIPATTGGDHLVGTLVERMERWDGLKAVMQKMPLADPLRNSWDLNSSFGTRNDPINNRTGIHEGIDLGAPHGSPVYATGEGTTVFAGPADRYGLMVEVDHGAGVRTRYAHLSRLKVKPGQKVGRTTVIGLLGNTGRSTGAHLHYEVRVSDSPRDPIKFIRTGHDAPKAR